MVAKKIQEKVKENTKEKIHTPHKKTEPFRTKQVFGYILINNMLTHFAVSGFNDALYKEQVIIVTAEKLPNWKAV